MLSHFIQPTDCQPPRAGVAAAEKFVLVLGLVAFVAVGLMALNRPQTEDSAAIETISDPNGVPYVAPRVPIPYRG